MSEPRVHVIGVPPGATHLDAEPLAVALGCGLLCGAERHLDLMPDFRGERLDLSGGLHVALDRIARDPGLEAAVLASGDPNFFGVAALMRRRVPPQQVRVWPAVSSMQLAFARAGESWSEARFASVHGRPLENLAEVLGAPTVGLFTDGSHTPATIARFLQDAGWDDLEMVVAEDLGLVIEKVTRGPVGQFLDWSGSDLNVVLLLGRVPDPRPLGPGLPEADFSHDRGLITKAEVRAVALGMLNLPRRGVLWDVGAGSGSVAVEACLLVPGLRAYAVEKTEAGIGHIRENRRRFRAAGLVPVSGVAPESLAELPDPDCVFVGGTGGNLAQILDCCLGRLRPDGTLVVSSVLTETLAETLAWCKSRNLALEFRELGASRSRPVAGRHRLEPQNPVTLVRVVTESRGS